MTRVRPMLVSTYLCIGMAVLVQYGAAADRSSEGKQIFDRWCGNCHAPVSLHRQLLPGTYALQSRYKGAKPAALEERTDLSKAFVKAIVRTGRNVMPATRKTEISDGELDALANYLGGHTP